MSKIRILVIPSDTYAVGKFRLLNPFTYLQENYGDDFYVDIVYDLEDDDKIFDNYDIIVGHSFIHNKVDYEGNLKRIEWLKNKGKIVIIDTDDFWEPDFRHPMFLKVKETKINKKKIELIKSASYVTTTTPIYRNTIINKLGVKPNNVIVFPNAIDETESQFIPNPTKSDRIRFSWLGGSSHLHDLELMRTGISQMYTTYKDKIQFVLCGYDLRGTITEINKISGEQKTRNINPEESVWFKYEQIFTNNYNILDDEYKKFLLQFKELEYNDIDKPYRRRWTKEITKYALNYNNFDVSLAPLVESVFNSNKSQLKAIEAGFHKKALIASESEPYTLDLINGENSLLVSQRKNHKQWFQHMKKLVDNPNMIEDLGNKLYETVYPKYSMKKVCQDRVEFLKSIINN